MGSQGSASGGLLASLLSLEHRHAGVPFAELRQRVLADRDGWRAFVERYSRFVYTVALRLSGPGPERADLAHEVYLGVFERLAHDGCRLLREFRGESRFETYLFSAVRHELAERRRRRAQERERFRQAEDEPAAPTDRAVSFAEELGLDPHQVGVLVERALAGLDSHERLVLRLRFGEGLPYRRLAELFCWKDTNAAAYEVCRIVRKLDLLGRCRASLRWGEPEREVVIERLGRWLESGPADEVRTESTTGGSSA